MSDTQLIKRIAKGDQEALRELINIYKARLFYYAYGILRDYEDAQEAVSETFFQVWRSAKNFRGDSKVSTWLFGITRNVMRNMLRKRTKEVKTVEIMEHDAVYENDPWEPEDVEVLKKALERLSPAHREVLHLAFYEELSYEEISQVLGVPVGTVKTRVFYAKKKLLELIKEIRDEELKKSF
ncbi:RNA polymerase sigma factor [Hydrogenobacter hydrogenophilus]|uniref:RNA polymerase sigma-70 factor, ECF subfamily n=1 Tax=Hydrogenobacter hydrogenophilus TaxID=35835 RepID=A0A285NRI2_9AQUI|nr:sigma-70 family RNA polymerase sigma factor [Hydrogenobacter hydrogenophilus]SNZ12122.1 RNA polymerase sigma-70 factor, ECF subfamily [Hydrogenobacter hydrogenophilus]